MKIIEPKVELWSEENISPESHIARCARTCYGHENREPNQEKDKKMVEGLVKRGHSSMLRHSSVYIFNRLKDFAKYIDSSAYWNNVGFYGYGSTNLQEFHNIKHIFENHADDGCIETFSNKLFLEKCAMIPELFNLYRLTFCITTQISTSRELNRVSPNNIAERSTRFCSSKDGLEICRPWWFGYTLDDQSLAGISKLPTEEKIFALAWREAEYSYMQALENGMKPEDARGLLPLDTATKVIYTYSIDEWEHIIGLRYYGTTGTSHPNAKLVIGMVRDQINKFAKEHNIDFKL